MFRPVALLAVTLILIPVASSGQEHYCTLEAHTWGARGASFNGVRIPLLVDQHVAASDPVVLGVAGRSVTFTEGSEPCIVNGLPGGGRPGALPEGIGDLIISSAQAFPQGSGGGAERRLWTTLLGQAVALSLNMRLDPDLASAPVDSAMRTVAALPGPDGLYGTDDDVICPDCDTLSVSVPEAVLAAVEEGTGTQPTVGGVLGLASAVLGGGESYGAEPRQVARALRSLNRAFHGSRFLVGAPPDTIIVIPVLRKVAGSDADRGDGLSLRASGPVGCSAALRLAVEDESLVRLVAYAASGREVALVAERVVPAGETTIEFPADRSLPSGVYFVRATASSLRTGDVAVRTTTAVVLR